MASHLIFSVAAFGAGVYCAKTYLSQPKSGDEKEEKHKQEAAATGEKEEKRKEKHGNAAAGNKDEKQKKKHKHGEGATDEKEKHKAKKSKDGKSDDSNRRSHKKDKHGKKDKSGHRSGKKKDAESPAEATAEKDEAIAEQSGTETSQTADE